MKTKQRTSDMKTQKANQKFAIRVNQEYKSTPLQKASTEVKAIGQTAKAIGQTVRATTNLAKEKARAALQKQGVPFLPDRMPRRNLLVR